MKNLLFIAIIVAVLFGGYVIITQNTNEEAPSSGEGGDSVMMEGFEMEVGDGGAMMNVEDASTTGDSGSEPLATTSYAITEVATHSGASSCWSAIDGSVYDLTSWIPQHPGGREAILSLCGKDGTEAFHSQHDDAKKQADLLATMKIGALTQ